MARVLPSLSLSDDGGCHLSLLQSATILVTNGTKASWPSRAAWLFQASGEICDPIKDPNCNLEKMKVLALFITLVATILIMACAMQFFREDKEENLTPLCPQMVVKESDLQFMFATPCSSPSQADSSDVFDVVDLAEPSVGYCKIDMDWPDPFRPDQRTSAGVAATVRMFKSDTLLATVVARSISVSGQGLALCRSGTEVFGFVEEVKTDLNKYVVRHRTGVHLMTFIGNFDNWDVAGFNPAGHQVCWTRRAGNGDKCEGRISQQVDAGLVLSSLMAIYVNRRIAPHRSLSPRAPVEVGQSPRETGAAKQERPHFQGM